MKPPAKRDLTADEVERFLTAHPDFLKQRDELLMRLEIPHRLNSNGATSLIEYQVRRLRTQLSRLREQNETMIANGRRSEELEGRVHHLTLALLQRQRLTTVLATLYQALREQFAIDTAVVRLLCPPRRPRTYGGLAEFAVDEASLRTLFGDAVGPLHQSLYGNLTEEQCRMLFGGDVTQAHFAVNAGSCAVIPLVADRTIGLLGLLSLDAERFNTAAVQSSHYLLQLGENIAAVLRRWVDYGGTAD